MLFRSGLPGRFLGAYLNLHAYPIGIVLEVTADKGLKGERRGDWDFPEDGRTMYLGANASPVRCRLYEKGMQSGYRSAGRPDWVRLEVHVRPQKTARKAYSASSADDTWGASPIKSAVC